jgi:hypothetical protein
MRLETPSNVLFQVRHMLELKNRQCFFVGPRTYWAMARRGENMRQFILNLPIPC